MSAKKRVSTHDKTVTLKSGGSLTVSASLDMLAASAEDRAFLFDLFDRLATYAEPDTA